MAVPGACPRPRLNMVDPVVCVILVQGALECAWSERLCGMAIAVYAADAGPRTLLAGRLADQAAVHGVLTTLYDLGLPVIAVTVT
jgi:hypothetical protein